MNHRTMGQRPGGSLDHAMFRRAAACIVLVCVGMMAGTLMPPPRPALGELQVPPPPPAFKSGDQLSVPILNEIAATLNRIDGRLAKLEVVFNELSKPQPRSATSN